MDDLIIVLLSFLVVMLGLFIYSTIRYKSRLFQAETDSEIYRDLFIQFRDQGKERVIKHLNEHYLQRYRDEIKMVDQWRAEYCS